MAGRLLRRGKQFLKDNGFAATIISGLQWLITRPKILIPEPCTQLVPVEKELSFDQETREPRIVVQLHVFFPEVLDELIDYTNRIPYRFDCYVTTDTKEKAAFITLQMSKQSRANRLQVDVYPNRGRDVAPFLLQLAPCVAQYDYLLHLHSKGSGHEDFGSKWLHVLLESLLASPGYIAAILRLMEQMPKLGLVFQRTYWRVKPSLGWKHNRRQSEEWMSRMGMPDALPRLPQFPAGNMFWAKTATMLPVFQTGLTIKDFPVEAKQLDGTLAHCVERCWGCVAAARGYSWARVCPAEKESRV